MKLKKRTFSGTTSNKITAREIENGDLARTAAAEGMVLLKNENNILPLEDKKIALYGAGATKTVKGGTGSGDVNERASVNIYQGLKNAGYKITTDKWLASYEKIYTNARFAWRDEIFRKMKEVYDGNFFNAYSSTQFMMPCGDALNVEQAKEDGARVAIFVLSRVAGENADRHVEEGDYLISAEEKALLTQISLAYEKVILVINAGGVVDLSFVEEFENIDAILYYVQAGQAGGDAFADLITGACTPCGKLTDTWAIDYSDYPNADTFSHMNQNVEVEKYEEGIYVGYRYFDSYDIPVRYGFGYGLSYTEFSMDTKGVSLENIDKKEALVLVDVDVKNIGSEFSGKEVVEVYASCPQGRLSKEFRRLVGFRKTELLFPEEEQKLTVEVPLYQFASYDEEKSAWILEKGTYGIWVGNSLENAKLSGTIVLDEEVAMIQGEAICARTQEIEERVPSSDRMMKKQEEWMAKAKEEGLVCVEIKGKEVFTEKIDYAEEVMTGRAEETVNCLSEEQLIKMAAGDPGRSQEVALGSAGSTVPGAAAETSSAAIEIPWEVASMPLADGPAGLRLSKSYNIVHGQVLPLDLLSALEGGFFAGEPEKRGIIYYQYCTAIPVGTLLAQTWDVELIEEVGKMIGTEMDLFRISLWLAPGMNIHRNPLCGRNFEYYSEDPLLSGEMAAAMTIGVQQVPGCGTTIKHFACNNQEDNRMGSDSVMTERTLREIYLKGFEIAVKKAHPMSIMTSYNMINGIHAANSYDLCTKVTRQEWGFNGAIMTDWTTTTASTRGECTAAGCMRAGNDMVMPGCDKDYENLRKELREGTLKIEDLKKCVYHTVKLTLQSNQYEDAVPYKG